MRLDSVSSDMAEATIEKLRYGVPLPGMAALLTVGRESQIAALEGSLSDNRSGRALLVHANYGAGKSHLLLVLREIALRHGFAVSKVDVDHEGGVRFNRMDTILGAVCRQIEVPGSEERGVGVLFDAFANAEAASLPLAEAAARRRLSNDDKWNHSDMLKSPGMYVALRAWVCADGRQQTRERITDWLGNPERYRSQRKLLYDELVFGYRARFRDPRPEWQFYSDDVFLFHTAGHRYAWDALADLDNIARLAGCKGLILLVDEYEDVIQNLTRRNFQQMAFYNLFRFFSGELFPGKAYFAVTPDFAVKCKKVLLDKDIFDFDYSTFDALPSFRLAPLSVMELLQLSKRIRTIHGLAYNWPADQVVGDDFLEEQCRRVFAVESPDKIRRAIIAIVTGLDKHQRGQNSV